MKRILGKVQEMRDQRNSLEKQLRDLIHQDDITAALVTTERADMKVRAPLSTHKPPHSPVQYIYIQSFPMVLFSYTIWNTQPFV